MHKQSQVIFPQAVTYPQFFNHNLIDSNRILKVVIGTNSWIRAFYYQLFKIIFQYESQQQQPIDYAYLLITLAKQILTKIKDSNKIQKISNSIRIVQNFLQSQIQNSQQQFQACIDNNLEIDQALINIFSQLIILGGLKQANNSQKIKYLSQIFNQHINQFDKGIKIQESDTFLYIQNQNTVYIAYLNMISQFQQQQIEQEYRKNSNSNQHSYVNNIQKVQTNQQQIQHSQVVTTSLSPFNLDINQQSKEQKKQSPIDYLLTNKFRGNTNTNTNININSNSPHNIVPIIKVQQNRPIPQNNNFEQTQQNITQKSDNSLQFTLGNKKIQQSDQTFKVLNPKYMKHGETIQQNDYQDYTNKNRESIVEKRVIPRNSIQPTPKIDKKQFFYKPALINQGNSKSSPSSNDSRVVKKDPLDILNESQKGTFYRKFTDTRILNLLAQPYRTKVKMLKNRFIGVHSRDHRAAIYNDKIL